MKKLLLFSLLLVFGTLVLASGPSGPTKTTTGPTANLEPHLVTRSMKCTIANLKAPDKLLLRDIKTGDEIVLKMAEKYKVRAKKKSDFAGRKKLGFEDLAIGQEIRVFYSPASREITSIKVMKLAFSADS